MSGDGATLAVDYFDGRSARPRPATMRIAGDRLRVEGDGVALELPLAEVQWPERRRGGARVAHLPDGGSLHGHDGAAWDRFVRAAGVGESLAVRAQQSWRATAVAAVALLLVVAAGYLWGIPLAARGALQLVPGGIDRQLGDAVLREIDAKWLAPSKLPAAQQQRYRAAFERAVAAAWPDERPAATLLFRGGKRIGPNAFALPGGTIVVTDELVELVDGRDDAVVGVLAHELGHVRRRHGMRLFTQVALLGSVTAIAFGDFSSLLAAAPALFGQLAYSRDFEREADADAIAALRAAGLSPQAMVLFFERMAERRQRERAPQLGIALSTHPADAERIERFRAAAR